MREDTYHVRIVKRPRGRHGYSRGHFELLGVAGVNRTACGAAMTDYDVTSRDVRAILRRGGPDAARICAECLQTITQPE